MQINLDIPEELAAQLIPPGKDAAQAALEALAIEGYRARRLTEGQIKQMLGYETRMQVHSLLAQADVPLNYTQEMLEMDIEASDVLHREWLAQSPQQR
jgi:hypothetical protein